jgi:hypothetical protein
MNGYTYCGVVVTLKCEGCTANKSFADSSDQCTCQFICLSALHARRYIGYVFS